MGLVSPRRRHARTIDLDQGPDRNRRGGNRIRRLSCSVAAGHPRAAEGPGRRRAVSRRLDPDYRRGHRLVVVYRRGGHGTRLPANTTSSTAIYLVSSRVRSRTAAAVVVLPSNPGGRRTAVDRRLARAAARCRDAASIKRDSPHLPERPGGCFAQMGTVPFFPACLLLPTLTAADRWCWWAVGLSAARLSLRSPFQTGHVHLARFPGCGHPGRDRSGPQARWPAQHRGRSLDERRHMGDMPCRTIRFAGRVCHHTDGSADELFADGVGSGRHSRFDVACASLGLASRAAEIDRGPFGRRGLRSIGGVALACFAAGGGDPLGASLRSIAIVPVRCRRKSWRPSDESARSSFISIVSSAMRLRSEPLAPRGKDGRLLRPLTVDEDDERIATRPILAGLNDRML